MTVYYERGETGSAQIPLRGPCLASTGTTGGDATSTSGAPLARLMCHWRCTSSMLSWHRERAYWQTSQPDRSSLFFRLVGLSLCLASQPRRSPTSQHRRSTTSEHRSSTTSQPRPGTTSQQRFSRTTRPRYQYVATHVLRSNRKTVTRPPAPPGAGSLRRGSRALPSLRNCSHLGEPTRLGARASRPRRISAGKMPALPGEM